MSDDPDVSARAIGEVHAKEQSGRRLEEQIEALLRESPDACGDAKAGEE